MENLFELVNKDYDRLNVLMAPLPGSKNINPHQWDDTIEFWKKRIANYCRYNKKASFTVQELFQVFQHDSLKPWCLSGVVSELSK